MAKGKKRLAQLGAKKVRKEAAMKHPGGSSRYGRKVKWCQSHGVFGFQVPEPKPWNKIT